MDNKLNTIIDKYWEDFVAKRNLETTVKPSIPIIWFGDLEGYKKSSKKIITIAINPSNDEFPADNPFLRFPRAQDFYAKDTLNNSDKNNLILALNEYFKEKPYDAWFNHYEKVLNSFDASYKNGNNISINIDICTAIATNPTWNYLNGAEKHYENSLVNDLLDYLDPEIIFYSSNQELFKKNFKDYKFIQSFVKISGNFIVKCESRDDEKNNGRIISYIRLYSNGDKYIVWGRNRRTVFYGFTDKEKQEIILPSIRNKIESLENTNR